MRIDISTNYLPTRHHLPTSPIKALSIATATQNNSAKQPDFTHMTRQEMRDWVNEQLRSGKMTIDESSPFVAMIIKISAITGREIPAESDTERQNFIQNAKDGLQYALSNHNETTAKLLASTLSKMLC